MCEHVHIYRRPLKTSLLIALAKLKEEVAADEAEDEQQARMPVYGTGVRGGRAADPHAGVWDRGEGRKGRGAPHASW